MTTAAALAVAVLTFIGAGVTWTALVKHYRKLRRQYRKARRQYRTRSLAVARRNAGRIAR